MPDADATRHPKLKGMGKLAAEDAGMRLARMGKRPHGLKKLQQTVAILKEQQAAIVRSTAMAAKQSDTWVARRLAEHFAQVQAEMQSTSAEERHMMEEARRLHLFC